MTNKNTRSRGGETGRHARLKIWWPLGRAGSIPALGTTLLCGSSSVVEHDLAKVGVAGSTPVSRSIFPLRTSRKKIVIYPTNPSDRAPLRLTSCGVENTRLLSALLSLFVIFTSLCAASVELKPSYRIDSFVVTLKTLGISESNTTVLNLPKNRDLWRVPAFEIEKRLKELGYDTVSASMSLITFKKIPQVDFSALHKIIRTKYESHYPTLKIESLSIEPTGSMRESFKMKPECTLRLPESALRKRSGTFVVRCGKKRHYFRYDMEAAILVYKANHQIKKDKIIDSKSAKAEYVTFEKLFAPPVTDIGNGRYIARQNIPVNRILTEANLSPMPAVLKGNRVRCFYKEGALQIEFDAEALQNGDIGDTVSIRKGGGKILKGRVVEKNMVELK